MTSSPSLSSQEIRKVLDALDRSTWDEAVVTVGDVSISLARNGATLPIAGATGAAPPSAPAPAPLSTAPASAPAPVAPEPFPAPVAPVAHAPAPVAAVTGLGEGIAVTSPTIGILWRSPEPGAAPFVEVGTRVESGDVVCIVEVMKLMNNVMAPVSGIVTGIAVQNAGPVQLDQVLMTIAPEGG